MNTGRTIVDNPIKSSAEDLIGRATVASEFVRSIRKVDSSHGLVVGVLGPWGHGKSSFINLMKESFATAPELQVVEFNPWVFSGSQQLTEFFFREIAAELRIKSSGKFGDIADGLDDYGEALSPLAIIPWFGAWWDRATRASRAVVRLVRKRHQGSRAYREKIKSALLELEHPIIVVIDDIDRLSNEEIRDIFKLVRLTASFPNIIYVLAFDRKRVENALAENGHIGREYLEKIIQLGFDLPALPQSVIQAQTLEMLSSMFGEVDDLRFDHEAWNDVFFEIVNPLVKNLRDVSRLSLSARSSIRALGNQVEAVDLIALEAVRIFRPEIFGELRALSATLTTPPSQYAQEADPERQLQVDHLLKIAEGDKRLVRDLINRVFPGARQYLGRGYGGSISSASWKRDHRVANGWFLNLYFERITSDGLAEFQLSEAAYRFAAEADAFAEFLESIEPAKLRAVISGLDAYIDVCDVDSFVSISTTLLNRIYKIPEDEGSGIAFINRREIVVGRIVANLLKRIPDQQDLEEKVEEILEGLCSYSSRLYFIHTVGHKDGRGIGLISQSRYSSLLSDLAAHARKSHSPVPKEEWDLLQVYWQIAEVLGKEYVAPEFSNPDEIRSLIDSGLVESRSQLLGTRNVQKEERLWWEALIRVTGGEQQLELAVSRLREADGETNLVFISEQYLGGWRPAD